MEGKRQLEKRDFGKRLSLDSSLVDYMDSNKYIDHLLTQLREQHRSLWREKLAVARLQQEVAQRTNEGAMREKLIHELEEERHLRLQSEKRLREVTLESEHNRVQMHSLQQRFSRMEETVRNLLQSQASPEQKREETVNIMVYQERLSEDERKHQQALSDLHLHVAVDEDSRSESSSTDGGKGKTKLLLERLKALEAENSALALENENQREQYEKCLDEVANQVVQALLTQKDLREECVKLKTRVFDLEQQNRTLSILFQQRARPASDVLLQERQQNAKPRTPALKCSGSGLVEPGHLCPRNSCSSSDLSPSSTCSEYSSGSSYTWHDGKHLGKRQSSQNWDKRLSIDSSLPSGFTSSADELPPTRIKESHILEGLRKLQRRRVLLEPPSMITKWGYKDCMNSNEGIYSPGIKSSSLKEYPPYKPPGTGSPSKEPHTTFVYDTDSHEEADDDPSSLALQQADPSQGCRIPGRKLTHSVSDSLFGLELRGKHLLEGTSSGNSSERPERLTQCVSNCPLETKMYSSVHQPRVQRERDAHSQGHNHMAPHAQLSDTDENEALDELHIESSDERSPSDSSLTADTGKSVENLDILLGFGKLECGSQEEDKEQLPSHSEIRPATLGLITQHRVVKRTSSEECITVIFDAENGEPVEFSSHQTGVVTVTRAEISISPALTGSTAENTELLPQGITYLQTQATTKDYSFPGRPREETEKNIPRDDEGSVALALPDSFSPRTTAIQNSPHMKLTKPIHSMLYQSDSRSLASMGIFQKQGLTKIPARGKSSPQKSKTTEPEASTVPPSSSPVNPEKSTPFPIGKLSQRTKADSSGPLFDRRVDPHIPKQPTLLSYGPRVSNKKNWASYLKNQVPEARSRPLLRPDDSRDTPVRDKNCGLGSESAVSSPSLPPPPGRSVSLLARPSYDYPPPKSSAKPEPRVPSDTAKTEVKSPKLKGSFAPVTSSGQTTSEVLRKKPAMALKKSIFPSCLPSTEVLMHTQYPDHTPSGSCAIIAPGPQKVSPKRGVPKASTQQTLGTIHPNRGLWTPKTCPSTHELLEIASSKSLSPKRKGLLNDSVPISCQPSFSGTSESPSSQVNSPSPSSQLPSKSHTTTQDSQNPPEKVLKTRLPVGLKLLMKSPQLARKSSLVPGKQEKDSLNEASKSSVAVSRNKPEDSRTPESLETTGDERNTSLLDLQAAVSLTRGIPLEPAMPESSESGIPGADGGDGVENRPVKRSFSSSKPHLKPALGMNGAKARSQSFSIHSGDKPSIPSTEGPGKIRTHIITNTAERGNSLTRQNILTEGSPSKSPSVPVSENIPDTGRNLGHSFSRQGSLGSTESSSSQHGSPSKLPMRITPRSEGLFTTLGMEDQQIYDQGEGPRVDVHEDPGNDYDRCLLIPTSGTQVLQATGRVELSSHLGTSRISKLETSGRSSDVSTTETNAVSPEAPLSPSIEEKVMLCIQENVEKGQVQTKSTSMETKPKPGPSFTNWFGFRKSRLPALSSRRVDASKTKMEKKDVKLKSERKKEKKKPEEQRKTENELIRGAKSPEIPENGLQNKRNLKASQDVYSLTKFEPRSRPSAAVCLTEDTFMTELLNRVDKKGTPQTENGSNSVSCKSMLKGTSQGSCFASSSISIQGSQKKIIKAKVNVEIPRDSLVKNVNEDLQENEDDRIGDSAFQSHVIESNCLMRTLDSGIGTFPLPDSGNRSTGRYICQPDSPEDHQPLLSLQPAPSTASPARAQTLEREVPSSTDSQLSSDSTIVHSISDPIMTARVKRVPQSHLPKPTSSGKTIFQKLNEVESKPQNCSTLDYTEDPMTREPHPGWRSEAGTVETQELKQVEETKEAPGHKLSKISLETFSKFNSNTVILLEKENSPNKVEGQKEGKEKNEEVSLSSSDRPGVDNMESLSDSLYDSFSSCASQTSNDA
uniref:NCK-associated protein 5 n=1 Tax=Jaculus jaculus TaxID=51337 RepID=A0A8C5KSF1_JACJA